MTNMVVSNAAKNQVIVSTPGPQGPAGRTILNGSGAPANNLGRTNDFYYDVTTRDFYGPKLTDLSWSGATIINLSSPSGTYAFSASWEVGQLTGPVGGLYSKAITHNLGFYPNATVKTSGGDVLETGIDYNSLNQITLTMAQPFSGTVYLS